MSSIGKNIEGREAIQERKTRYINLYYDLETTFTRERHNIQDVYAIAWKVQGEDKIYKSFSSVRHKCMKKFLEFLCLYPDVDDENYAVKFRLIAYNGSRFDHLMLYDIMNSRDLVHKVAIYNRQIFTLASRYGHCIWDPCQFIKMPLGKAAKSFNLKHNKIEGFSHAIPQAARDNGTLDNWIEENEEKLSEYITYDVLVLEELVETLESSFKEMFPGLVFITISHWHL
jgi:hypothetical protein